MMGGESARGEGFGMMGEEWSRSDSADDGFDGPSAAAMIGMMAVLIAAVALAVFWLTCRGALGPRDRRRRLAVALARRDRAPASPQRPAGDLDHRLASGEITPEEYRERRATLGSRTEDSGAEGTT